MQIIKINDNDENKNKLNFKCLQCACLPWDDVSNVGRKGFEGFRNCLILLEVVQKASVVTESKI